MRINAPGSPHFEGDLMAFACPQVALLNLPKAQCAADVREAAAALESAERRNGVARPIGLLVNIETPRALRLAPELAAAHPRVAGLRLGLADLFESMRADRRSAADVHAAMFQMAMACAESGGFAYDSEYPDVADTEGFRREAEQARQLGYVGKSCVRRPSRARERDLRHRDAQHRRCPPHRRRCATRGGCRPRRLPPRWPDDRSAIRQARRSRAGRGERQQRSPVRALIALTALVVSAAAPPKASPRSSCQAARIDGDITRTRIIPIDDRPVVVQPGVVRILDADHKSWSDSRWPESRGDVLPPSSATAVRRSH